MKIPILYLAKNLSTLVQCFVNCCLPKVGPETTFNMTMCRCTHLTNFGGGFFVAPNPIDFDAVFESFSDLSSNPVVFATVLTIFGLYFVGVIWARWRDVKDLEKVS